MMGLGSRGVKSTVYASLPLVPSHWDVARLGRFARIETGGTPDRENAEYWRDGTIPWLASGEVNKGIITSVDGWITEAGMRNSNAKLLPADTVVIALNGQGKTKGTSALLRIASTCNQSVAGVICDTRRLLPLFLYYFTTAKYDEIRGLAGEQRDGLSLADVRSIPICVPPVSEQAAICDFLDRETAKVDALITKKAALIKLTSRRYTAILSQLATRGPDITVPTRPSGVPWLEDIPAHWQVRRLAMAVDKLTNGFVGPTRDILTDAGVPYLQSLHIKDGEVRFERHPYFVDAAWSAQHSKSVLRKGDVLVVQTGDLGQVAVVPERFDSANCHALIILRVKPELGYGEYLSLLLRSWYGKNALSRAETGALHPHLECGHVREIAICLPPCSEQEVILLHAAEARREHERTVITLKQGVDLLREYRSALIAAAVTGEVDVRDNAGFDYRRLSH